MQPNIHKIPQIQAPPPPQQMLDPPLKSTASIVENAFDLLISK